MRTAVTETSIDCYYGHDFTEQAKRVISAIEFSGEHGTCIADIADLLECEKSSVAARLNEIKKLVPCPIIKIGKKKSRTTGITSEYWRIVERKETLFD